MSINQVINIIGQPEKRSDHAKMESYGIPQSSYYTYFSKGIELLFNEDELTSIWLKNGINHGNSDQETLFHKYVFEPESEISLDSSIAEIEAVYGHPNKVITFDKNIPYKIHQYDGFDINVLTNSGKIATIRLKK